MAGTAAAATRKGQMRLQCFAVSATNAEIKLLHAARAFSKKAIVATAAVAVEAHAPMAPAPANAFVRARTAVEIYRQELAGVVCPFASLTSNT